MSEETLAILRRGHDAFNRGDASALRELASPDVEWGGIGAFLGVEGMYRGPDGSQWRDIIRSAWQKFEVGLDEVLHDGGDLVVVAELLRGRGRGTGAEVNMRVFSAYWFKAGKVRKRRAFTQQNAAFEAAGLSE
jgi:ketosteroid isomerase-like protein